MIMKNNIFILLLLLSSVFCSCEKYLDKMPDDQLTLDMVFNDKVRTEDWLAGIYASVPDPVWGYVREIGFDPLSDDMVPSTGWEQFGWTVIGKQTGNWNPTSSWSPNYWSELPKSCLLYTSDAADEEDSVDLGGRRIIKKKKNTTII